MKWYIIHTYSGFERKVKESLESRVQAFGLQDKIGQVLIPTESVTEVRDGKKYTMRAHVLSRLRAGGDGHGRPRVARGEVHAAGDRICGDRAAAHAAVRRRSAAHRLPRRPISKDKPKLKVKFEKNETVRITEGPFANFTGVVDEVNEDRETLKVMVTIFGRSTPVELEFGQVEKVVT